MPADSRYGGATKERRRRRAEKRLPKRVFWESPFLLCSLKAFRCFKSKPKWGQKRNGLSNNQLLDNGFAARRLLGSLARSDVMIASSGFVLEIAVRKFEQVSVRTFRQLKSPDLRLFGDISMFVLDFLLPFFFWEFRVENLLISYRIGKPRNSKITPNIQKKRLPENTFSKPPETQKIRNSYFWGIFLVFFRSRVVEGIRMSGWYFWPFLGAWGVFYSVADQVGSLI